MSPRDKVRAQKLKAAIESYQDKMGAFPGLADGQSLEPLVLQFIDSLRRVEFAYHIRNTRMHPDRMNPASSLFDPLRAAVLRSRLGETDEAWWLVFLATHFGKHHTDGWRLARDVYGMLGQGGTWDWATISRDPLAFRSWLARNEGTLRGGDGVSRRFSNHRKYETLRVASAAGTANVFASYVAWVAPPRKHADIVRDLHRIVGQDPREVFAALYRSMRPIPRFGRLATFDFLCMLGKLGIAPVEPGSTYLSGATGPLAGARLLFGGARDANISANCLEERLIDFGNYIEVGSQVLEDTLCNWQKSPANYVRFRG